MTIELIRNFFEFDTPKFNKLNNEFRRRIFEEIASSELSGLIFTYVTEMTMIEEKRYLEKITEIFKKKSSSVFYIELEATLDERIKRNKTALRLEMKPSKRNIKQSEERLLRWEKKYIMNSSEKHPFFFQQGFLKIENTHLTAKEAAIKIKEYFEF
jgi:hypothetical protein